MQPIYSVVLLAVFRLVTISKIDLFGKWINSKRYIFAGILANFMVSILMVLVSKVPQAVMSEYLCYGKLSTNMNNLVIYVVLTTSLCVILPSLLVVGIYFHSLKYLQVVQSAKTCASMDITLANRISRDLTRKSSVGKDYEKKQLKQFTHLLFINIFVSLTSVSFTIMSFLNIVELKDSYFVSRILCVFVLGFQICVPLFTMYNLRWTGFVSRKIKSWSIRNRVQPRFELQPWTEKVVDKWCPYHMKFIEVVV